MVIEGRIVYRLELQDCSTESRNGRVGIQASNRSQAEGGQKRRCRPIANHNDNMNIEETTGFDEVLQESSTSRLDDPWRTAGYYFIPDSRVSETRNNDHIQHGRNNQATNAYWKRSPDGSRAAPKEYMLSLPHHLLLSLLRGDGKLGEAQPSQVGTDPLEYHVRILDYSIVPLVQNGKQLSTIALIQVHDMEHGPSQSSHAQDSPHDQGSSSVGLPTSSLSIQSQPASKALKTRKEAYLNDFNVLSLKQLKREESVDDSKKNKHQLLVGNETVAHRTQGRCGQQNRSRLKRSNRKKYTVCATVDSISPIIAMEPSDPFALLELYDGSDLFFQQPPDLSLTLKSNLFSW